MQVYYAPGINGQHWTLEAGESKHLVKVLRMRKDDEVQLIDGLGNLYYAVITDPDPDACTVTVSRVIRDFESRNYRLHIAISPLKNPERFEWFLEKCVEIGLEEVTPLICHNTEKTGIRSSRLNNIIISAMKQSLKARLTRLNEPVKFSDFIKQATTVPSYIAHCNDITSRSNLSEIYRKGDDAVILIGPEGDFSDTEIKEAVTAGYQPVHLGTSRLRTETAGVAACHSIYFLNQS